MELALSLGDTPKPFTFLDKAQKVVNRDLGFCMGLGKGAADRGGDHQSRNSRESDGERRGSSDPPVQLDLLPFSPVPRSQTSSSQLSFSWLTQHCNFSLFDVLEFSAFLAWGSCLVQHLNFTFKNFLKILQPPVLKYFRKIYIACSMTIIQGGICSKEKIWVEELLCFPSFHQDLFF